MATNFSIPHRLISENSKTQEKMDSNVKDALSDTGNKCELTCSPMLGKKHQLKWMLGKKHQLKWMLGLLLMLCCLSTAESTQCNESKNVEGRLGKKMVMKFQKDDFLDGKIIQKDSNFHHMKAELKIVYKDKMNYTDEQIIFENGKAINQFSRKTEIILNYDSIVIKIEKLQKEHAGIYVIRFNSSRLGYKKLTIAGKPIIKNNSSPNPVLIADSNTTIQLECPSVSNSIGDCQRYTLWYKNGERMTELDPTLSQINVTVDRNGGKYTCLVTEFKSCFDQLMGTKSQDVIEGCENMSESKTFVLKAKHAPIDVKLEPDQREITVNKDDDLEVKCSAKCQPKCDVTWTKDSQDLDSSKLVNITETLFGKDLKIENIDISDAGFYVCLVNNSLGEVKKNFTLSVTETDKKDPSNPGMIVGIVCGVVVVSVVVGVIVYCIMKKRRQNGNGIPVPQEDVN